jgi:hypothetical protein
MAASTFKILNEDDIVSTRTLLHEAIPLTGTIVSGTYADANINNPSHGMFQSVYDYPYLSSSANHIFDITFGVSANSAISSSVTSQAQKKQNIYNQMSQLLMGYNTDGTILELDEDGNILAGGTKIRDAIFLPFSRLLVKDEIKKGTFSLSLGVAQSDTAPFTSTITVTDVSGANGYFVNSPVGEYGILQASGSALTASSNLATCGLLFYQAGIAVLTSSVFQGLLTTACHMNTANNSLSDLLTGSTVQTTANSIRQRIDNIQFNNTTELNSTIYFCRINHNEFNYSTNPTYVNASKIRVKTNSTDEPISYITTIGLYSDKNELMAVAKLSEPLKKSPSTEFTIRARLDY